MVLAGNGPLLYQLGAQLAAAGAKIVALLETEARYGAALPHLPHALAAGGYLAKGLGLIRAIKRAGVPIHRNVAGLKALGKDRLEGVEFACNGRVERLDCDVLCLHQGVIPNVQLAMAIPVKHEWNEPQQRRRPAIDVWGNTDVPGIAVAGDGAGIGGAEAAVHSGRIAAYEAAFALGRMDMQTREARAGVDCLGLGQASAHPAVPRRPLPPVVRHPGAGRRRHRLPVRGGHRRPGATRYARAVPGRTRSSPSPAPAWGPARAGCAPRRWRRSSPRNWASRLAEVGTYRVRFPIKPLTVGELATLE